MHTAGHTTLRLIVRPAASSVDLTLRHERGESLATTVSHPLDWVAVRDESRRVRQVLARTSQHAGGNDRDEIELRELAASLAQRLFPTDFVDLLSRHIGAPIGLQLSGAAHEIPWEILPVAGRPLALQFAVGRIADNDRDERLIAGSALVRGSIQIGLAVNPEFDLPGTVTEADALCRLFDAHDLSRSVMQRRHRVSRNDLSRLIEECDWLHFAGHAEVTSAGVVWMLADGDWTGSDWEQVAPQVRTRFVFAHACSSSANPPGSAKSVSADILGVDRILATGVCHVLGTVVPIPDRTPARFSEFFYRELLAGQPIGEAVRRARCQLVDECRAAGLLWSVYILHGPPDQSLLRNDTRQDA